MPDRDSISTTALVTARGTVRYAQGRWQDAYDDFVESDRLDAAYSPRSQTRWFRADAAMALAHMGKSDAALACAEQEVAIARDWGDPTSIGRALHARGMAKRELGIADLEAAAEVLTGVFDLGLASCLIDLGATLRRMKRRSDARLPRRRALEIADRIGARAYAESARTELAASGLQNPQIAQQLFVTRKTVESHLAHVFTKLDISSRDQLHAILGDPLADGAAWPGQALKRSHNQSSDVRCNVDHELGRVEDRGPVEG